MNWMFTKIHSKKCKIKTCSPFQSVTVSASASIVSPPASAGFHVCNKCFSAEHRVMLWEYTNILLPHKTQISPPHIIWSSSQYALVILLLSYIYILVFSLLKIFPSNPCFHNLHYFFSFSCRTKVKYLNNILYGFSHPLSGPSHPPSNILAYKINLFCAGELLFTAWSQVLEKFNLIPLT